MNKQHIQSKPSRPRGYRSNRGQATLVEFVMVVPLFFVLVFGMIDMGRIFFVQVTLQNAMRQAGRYAITGNHLPGSSGSTMTRVASISQVAQNAAAGLSVGSIVINSYNDGVLSTNSAGGPSDTVAISLTTSLKLFTPMMGKFFPNGAYQFTVSTTFKNEPFPPSMTN